MTRVTISSVLVMMCASAVLGAGDLTFMKKPSATASYSRVYVSRFAHGGADKARGLVNEHSVVGVVQGMPGGVQIAIDSAKPDATQPDLVRLDFSGKGKFTGAPTASIKMRPSGSRGATMGTVGPVIVAVKRDGQSIPVFIRGTYWKQNTSRGLSLMLTSAVEGSCKFGAKTYPVRVIDGNSNLKFTDALKPPYRPSTTMAFDRITVGDSNGAFSRNSAGSYVGQPISVDGKLYSVDISGMKIKATPMKIAGGSVKVNAPRWSCTLVGKKYYLSLTGGKAPVSVPADEYVTANYTVFTGSDPRKRCATIRGYGSYRGGKAFTVGSGQTVDLALGAPIEATVLASKRAGKVSINLMMKDPLGGRISSITTEEGKRPPAPSIDVVDKSGKTVYTAKLEYG